jgi:hypothetical protein
MTAAWPLDAVPAFGNGKSAGNEPEKPDGMFPVQDPDRHAAR